MAMVQEQCTTDLGPPSEVIKPTASVRRAHSSGTKPSNSSCIEVLARLRPMNDREMAHSVLPVIKASTNERAVTVMRGHGSKQTRHLFSFDKVYTAFSSQQEIFDDAIAPIISDVMQGYESSIIAYGQTGTGKTHTMEGSLDSPELYGVIPRSAEAIFDTLSRPDFEKEVVKCSYLEIYNEELRDLLVDSENDENKAELEIIEGLNGRTYCRGLREVKVRSAADVLDLMHKAQKLKHVGETKMNSKSSRSHCLFTFEVRTNRLFNDGSMLKLCGKLHMVDLAGSESAKMADDENTHKNQAQERERKNINRSLLALGRVITILKDRNTKKSSTQAHIPYRDSKLTRFLQESLGGRCKTVVITTLSPSVTSVEESLSTLNYAQSVSSIKSPPITKSSKSLESIGNTSVDTLEELECRLEYMNTQVEEAQSALQREHKRNQLLIQRLKAAEAETEKKNEELEVSNGVIKALERALIGTEQAMSTMISVEVYQTDVDREKKKKEALFLLQGHTSVALKKTKEDLAEADKSQNALMEEATDMMESLQKAIDDGERYFNLFTRARRDSVEKMNATKSFHDNARSLLYNIVTKLEQISVQDKKNQDRLIHILGDRWNVEMKGFQNSSSLIISLRQDIRIMKSAVRNHVINIVVG